MQQQQGSVSFVFYGTQKQVAAFTSFCPDSFGKYMLYFHGLTLLCTSFPTIRLIIFLLTLIIDDNFQIDCSVFSKISYWGHWMMADLLTMLSFERVFFATVTKESFNSWTHYTLLRHRTQWILDTRIIKSCLSLSESANTFCICCSFVIFHTCFEYRDYFEVKNV